jgi:polysaccharide pyruvyl transferase WcaK-like protein
MIRILHVASFIGNIGDNASHMGFYSLLDELVKEYQVEQLEIRRFYKKYNGLDKQYFDADFVKYANTFDYLVIGGGGFLDYWIEGSASGTTIDIEPDLVGNIIVPTLITSVGCIPHHDVPEGNIQRFQKFLDAVLNNKNILLAVRNDGSINSFKEEIGAEYLVSISELLDNGFYYQLPSNAPQLFPSPYVAINITNDQLTMKSKSRSKIDVERYYTELSKVVNHLIKEMKVHVVMVPHIHADLTAISKLIGYLDDFTVRNSLSVAPCLQGNEGADFIFGIYQKSQFVIATRYHANVCNLASNKPTFGLGVLDRVKYLYDQLDLPNRYIQIEDDFSIALINQINAMNENDWNSPLELAKRNTKTVYADFFMPKDLT